ncbi:hypothetical protein GCM10025859_14810 [Alicyclobacillus fastidiosus]|nr:hypothetical protein GCM10025859_14810 [Alicyclobacillus fastidiosus]
MNEFELYEQTHGEYVISTDRERIDLDVVYEYLHNYAYWCNGILVRSTRELRSTAVHWARS